MHKFFSIFENRFFLISFGLSLAAGMLVFFAIVLIFGAVNDPDMEVFYEEEEPEYVLQIPMPDDWETEEPESEDEFPYPTQVSILTGIRIHEDDANRRPLAFVINNIRQALPQSGITSADIVYEVLAEGDVTRLIAVFQSYIPEKIGSIRSARDYFVDIAYNHDAIFIHHGGSPSGYSRIRSTKITAMDGGQLEGRGIFWRDRTFPSWARETGTRSSEHSSYTGREKIEEHIEANEIRYTTDNHPSFGFLFAVPADGQEEILTANSANTANIVRVPFSQNYVRTFVFDREENVYRVENRDGEHRDAETEETVTVSNILIQLTRMHVIAGDEAGRRSVTTVGEGEGYLITNGAYVPVRWKKTAIDSPTFWTFQNGSPLTLTPGRTWICIFQHSGTVTFSIED
ncbi:MAG: DUF3048 domain-containing protein [Clostridiales bacterium]|jgi:hypothetical protein|nr:DUF3048 domain-containing protein [Clostridiales bacterium]